MIATRMTKNPPQAFSILELVVVLVIVGLLLALLLPTLSMARRLAHNTSCKANLRQIFHQSIAYYADHNYHMPWMATQVWTYDQANLICPSDDQPTLLPPQFTGAAKDIAVSYGFNPEFALMDKRYTQIDNPSRVLLAFEASGQLDADADTSDASDEDDSSSPFNGSQVTITHFPPGNRDNPQVITIPLSALQAHLKHGDVLGNWLAADQTLSPALTLQSGFVKRHRQGQIGNILFADGYVDEVDHLPADGFLSREDTPETPEP